MPSSIEDTIQASSTELETSRTDTPRLFCDQRFFQRKYLVDRCFGGVLLVLTSPLTLALYLLVKATSPGPGFYLQERVGLDGKTFLVVKLRSMRVDAEACGKAKWCGKNDPRVTRVGKVLRKLHLDELPQLWNVAKGEMSLIGPRPERPVICESLAEKIPGYYRRITVKPGVTGLAQINLPPDESIEDVQRKQILDLHYIEETNLWLETRIFCATALRVVGLQGETVMKWMRLCRLDVVNAGMADLVSVTIHGEDGAIMRLDRSEQCETWGAADSQHSNPNRPR
ncbi:sugar transferase [Roseimaritima ulvae]|uniref:Undecaprenyl-phosphate N-acetylgalactosaminyl 1-phosphate transferase n=1 Tax=Roseimaritima ulvae TaxID=980254 RepID=A0A5B9QWV0_9BACT|nr:sugar transferase [Roseimaritima ulvae]QEG42472.1 Putative undecaprenyl-phosphate N-acetylgalactosaminyl 1-phosphate transferase [Roseimaritima ulvae]